MKRSIRTTGIRSASGRAGRAARAAVAARGVRRRVRGNALRRRRAPAPAAGRGLLGGAYAAGVRAARNLPRDDPSARVPALNRLWAAWAMPRLGRSVRWSVYHAAARRFLTGCARGSALAASVPQLRRKVLLPTGKRVAAIVAVQSGNAAIAGVLDQLSRLPLTEIVVVTDSAHDSSFDIVRQHPAKPIVIRCEQPLGHHVGRAVAAKTSAADILLFADEEIAVAAERLVPFVHAVERGTDVALNDTTPLLPAFRHRNSVSVVKEFVNLSCGRPDLGASSLADTPHALSRKAVDALGAPSLIVPPKAQALAVACGLAVSAPATARPIRGGRKRGVRSGHDDPLIGLALGDHLEALEAMQRLRGERLHYKDAMRMRAAIGEEAQR